MQAREKIFLGKFLLNLAGCCNTLFNRNFAAEIIEIERKRGNFFSIAICKLNCNASEDIQIFSEAFVRYVHSSVASEIVGH